MLQFDEGGAVLALQAGSIVSYHKAICVPLRRVRKVPSSVGDEGAFFSVLSLHSTLVVFVETPNNLELRTGRLIEQQNLKIRS